MAGRWRLQPQGRAYELRGGGAGGEAQRACHGTKPHLHRCCCRSALVGGRAAEAKRTAVDGDGGAQAPDARTRCLHRCVHALQLPLVLLDQALELRDESRALSRLARFGVRYLCGKVGVGQRYARPEELVDGASSTRRRLCGDAAHDCERLGKGLRPPRASVVEVALPPLHAPFAAGARTKEFRVLYRLLPSLPLVV